MKQQTLAVAADQNTHYEAYRRPTKRDAFLATMEQIVPWAALCAVIEPHYPKAGNGRPPVGLERMLRMYFVQHWFNLADAACEDALLEQHKLGEALFAKVGEILQAKELKGQQWYFRHEAAHWRGQQDGAGTQRSGHLGQRA